MSFPELTNSMRYTGFQSCKHPVNLYNINISPRVQKQEIRLPNKFYFTDEFPCLFKIKRLPGYHKIQNTGAVPPTETLVHWLHHQHYQLVQCCHQRKSQTNHLHRIHCSHQLQGTVLRHLQCHMCPAHQCPCPKDTTCQIISSKCCIHKCCPPVTNNIWINTFISVNSMTCNKYWLYSQLLLVHFRTNYWQSNCMSKYLNNFSTSECDLALMWLNMKPGVQFIGSKLPNVPVRVYQLLKQTSHSLIATQKQFNISDTNMCTIFLTNNN